MSLSSTLELSCGIVVACLPATRRFLSVYLPKASAVISKYTSRLGTRRGSGKDTYCPGGSNSKSGGSTNSLGTVASRGGGKTKPARKGDCPLPGTPRSGWAFDKKLPRIPTGEEQETEEEDDCMFMTTMKSQGHTSTNDDDDDDDHHVGPRIADLTQSDIYELRPRPLRLTQRSCSPPITAGSREVPTSRWCTTGTTSLPPPRRLPAQHTSLAAALVISNNLSSPPTPRDERVCNEGRGLLSPLRGAHACTELDARNSETT